MKNYLQIKSLFNRPSTIKSATDGAIINFTLSRPIRQAKFFSINFIKNIRDLVFGLFRRCRPFAVSFGVVSVIVYTIKRRVFFTKATHMIFVTFVHIISKVNKIHPLFTHSNSTPAPSIKSLGLWIKTACLHMSPNLIETSFNKAMFFILAATTFCFKCLKRIETNNFVISTNTSAQPPGPSLLIGFDKINSGQICVHFPFNILNFHKSHA